MATTKPTDGLAKMREPFPDHQISTLPKPTAKREEMDKLPKATCKVCGGYHATSKVIHLDYVGHAALTDRLLDSDPSWTWEPLAMDESGLPRLDSAGGLWIKLTVCGVTRLGYGDAGAGKASGDTMKERIGDALRNAAMRFGAALEFWHKGELHLDGEGDEPHDHQPQHDHQEPQKPQIQEWDNEALSRFSVIDDRAYEAFKKAGRKDDHLAFSKKWKECRQANPPAETLAKFEEVVKKLEDAAVKKEVENLGLSS